MKRIILFSLTFTSLSIAAQIDKQTVTETVSRSDIEGHIYFLADDLLKGRETGTPELKIAASYLANSLRRYGVKPNPKTGTYFQPIRLKKLSPPATVNITLNGQIMTDYAVLSGAMINSNRNTVFLGHGLENDYKGKSVKGKLIVVLSGSSKTSGIRTAFGLRRKKQQLAKDNGALGIIELIKANEELWKRIKHNFNGSRLSVAKHEDTTKNDFAYVWLLDKKGTLEKNLQEAKKVSVKLIMNPPKEEIILSQNIIGIVEGTDPKLKNEYIIYSGHYDHVGIGSPDATGDTIYNGARDNAVGTTTVLSMAENLAKYPTKRSALFILFTGEEKGLLGSNYYVENPVLPLHQMVYCFNSDNAGYNDTSLATIIGLPRTTAAKHIKSAAKAFDITAVDDPAPEQGLFDRSDNVHFARKGIPAPTFSLGFTAFNGDVTKYYHQPGDEAHTLDYDYLLKFFRAYVLAGRKIANDPITPTWVAGDKYEAASKNLYKN